MELNTVGYSYGDWVVYDAGYRKQLGRVVEVRGDTAFVCYSKGCTSAATDVGKLRLYDESTDNDIRKYDLIGFHRFDACCPCYDEDCCYASCKERFGKR